MKKTNLIATIGEFHPLTGEMCYFDREVYLDEHNNDFVKLRHCFVSIAWLLGAGRDVEIKEVNA